MSIRAKVLLDSITEGQKYRLTTLEVVIPRVVLCEFNTHRALSRNSASSRAIPVEKMIRQVEEDPYIPIHWGQNQKGMSATSEIADLSKCLADEDWLGVRDFTVSQVKKLIDLGVHKQVANRLLEPFMWQTIIVSATDWENFFALRDNQSASPEMQETARSIRRAIDGSTPYIVPYTSKGEWHMPFITEAEYELFDDRDLMKISVGRCARVSYLTHDGKRDPGEDIRLHDRLLESGHMSPFEHIARPSMWFDRHTSNFTGWTQYRKLIPNEACHVIQQQQ